MTYDASESTVDIDSIKHNLEDDGFPEQIIDSIIEYLMETTGDN